MNCKLETSSPDPFNVLSTTRKVLKRAKHVVINRKNIDRFAYKVQNRINNGLFTVEEHYAAHRSFEEDVQLVCIEDSINFCF